VSGVVPPSTALAFVTEMNEKRKYTSPSALQVENRRKTIGTERNLGVKSKLEKGERIVDIFYNVRFIHTQYVQIVIS
jgi:hypothetical protein